MWEEIWGRIRNSRSFRDRAAVEMGAASVIAELYRRPRADRDGGSGEPALTNDWRPRLGMTWMDRDFFRVTLTRLYEGRAVRWATSGCAFEFDQILMKRSPLVPTCVFCFGGTVEPTGPRYGVNGRNSIRVGWESGTDRIFPTKSRWGGLEF